MAASNSRTIRRERGPVVPRLAPRPASAPPALPASFYEWLASLDQPPPEEPVDYGPAGYYDGGGGGTTIIQEAPQAPPYDPAQDPSFQQLLASLGLQETQARTQATQRIAQAQEEGAIAVPRIQEQGQIQRRNIGLGWEGRGLFRSGARLRDLAEQERSQSQRLGDVERGVARQTTSANQTLDQQILDLATRRNDAAFQARLRSGTG